MPTGKTTRRTSNKKVTVKVKPTKTKKARVKKPTHKQRTAKGRVGAALTGALNTYKSVKRKIIPPKETRIANREARQERRSSVIGDDIVIPRLKGKVISSEEKPTRKTGINAVENEMRYPMKPGGTFDHDGAIDSDLSYRKQDMEDLEIVADKKPKPKKKDNTLLFLLIAAVVIFLIIKSKK